MTGHSKSIFLGKPQLLVWLMLMSVISPLAAPVGADSSDTVIVPEPKFEMYADIDDFNAIEGKPYTFFEDDEPIYSATRFFKQAWIEAGRPGVDDFVDWQPPTSNARAARACSRHSVGDTVSVPASGGSVSTTVQKTTNTVAFLVQDGRTLSSTVL
ncbi:MAG: hypothetical protein QGH90_04210, partial [Candidatus Poseidoniaceae archaeon]|nr:hypothetical protein [Candidatus Poseidoniaceae archaeon]